MTDRAAATAAAATGLRAFADQMASTPATIGFDGFVDSIIAVVDKRTSVNDYTPVKTIEQFGRKILDAAGKSGNYELAVKLQKLGGNGPIMANAMASFGLPVTYIGALGYPKLHPVFEEFARSATVHSICQPGMTDALEFEDGKLMLGKYEVVQEVRPARIDQTLGFDRFKQIVADTAFLGMVNWTMLSGTSDIWRYLADHVLPACKNPPLIFVDLADPEKRTDDDLLEALNLLSQMQKQTQVVLGVNLKEAIQVARVLGVDATDDPAGPIEQMTVDMREKLETFGVVIHPRQTAAAALKIDGQVQSSYMTGAFTKTPKLSPGAGDNFNAGFCLGLLAGLDVAASLCVGNAASGFYVRNARSASLAELADFVIDLPEPEWD